MKKYLKFVLPAVLASVLAACGGGGSGSSTPVAATPPAFDAFTTIVSTTYLTPSDTAEPAVIDSIAATAPETIESAAI
ncbi:MAG: hypothetical protein H7327_01150 [Herminiimonas sp.]|nr:hypothetical protein [Herminiimonas sp.]